MPFRAALPATKRNQGEILMAYYGCLLRVAVCGALLLGCVQSTAPVSPLGAGQEAPDISGVDSDGKEIKLSDYRGKVVLVNFWFDECTPCRINHEHERGLVKKY